MNEPALGDYLVNHDGLRVFDGTDWVLAPPSVTLPPVSSVLPGTKITISSNNPLVVSAAGWEIIPISEGHVYEAPEQTQP